MNSSAALAEKMSVGGDAAFCAVNPHCLESIVRLSDEMEVLAACDIMDDRGVKLWARGAPVSRSLQEKMLQRRLKQPLEASLEVGQGATMESIVGDCLALMKDNMALNLLGGSAGARSVLRSMSALQLPAPLRLLLTSAREHKKRTYQMSLADMIVCAGMANSVGLGDHDAGMLILSALVHDIGEMYINPEYLDGSRPLLPHEWKHVASHPVVGQAFLKAFTKFPTAVSDCVLHHHERLDGSGYPSQVAGAKMCQLGKLIAVADSVSAIVLRGGAGVRQSVGVALRIVPEEFPRPAVSYIMTTLAQLGGSESAPAESGSFSELILPTLQQIRSAKQNCVDLAALKVPRVVALGEFAFELISNLDKSLRATGVYELSQLDVLESDEHLMGEACLVLREVKWRLRNLARNVHLRIEKGGDPHEVGMVAGLIAALNGSPPPLVVVA